MKQVLSPITSTSIEEGTQDWAAQALSQPTDKWFVLKTKDIH